MGSNPYGSLEPGTPDPIPKPLFPEVSSTGAIVRGFRKRCPRCGERDTFVTWFQSRTACPRLRSADVKAVSTWVATASPVRPFFKVLGPSDRLSSD